MLDELARLVRPGGVLSVLCLNGDAIGMRDGLRGWWRDALDSIGAGGQVGDLSLPTRADTVAGLSGELANRGLRTEAWYGVRVFTDHLGYDEHLEPSELDTVCELEWVAGQRDPYRSVARLFHLVATRVSP
jgi:S-adenosylmethionine-dependent methyltransferase